MQFFKVKWENIMTLMILAETIYAWVVYFKYATEVRMLVIAIMSTIALTMMLIGYDIIKTFRHEVIKSWQ